MTTSRDNDYLLGLVRELRKLPHETEWVEFKVDHDHPDRIGQNISALANGAALHGKMNAYMLWGIENHAHSISDTAFSPGTAKKGNEPLETWLLRLLHPRIDFRFHEVTTDEGRVVLLEIDRAARQPVSFRGVEYIRVGSTTRKLKEYPEKERELWRVFDRVSFEDGFAAERVSGEDVLLRLDYPAYFDLLGAPPPDGRAAILDTLRRDRIITSGKAGGFDITNVGAVLLARNLGDFRRLGRKRLRVIEYRGAGRTEALKEHESTKGYASGFEELVDYIDARLPAKEEMGQALRKEVPEFPKPAVRELVGNALIHQDFSVTGAGPMVEIFDGRLEITNPGEPLVETQRFLDSPPASRNEALTSLMRQFLICEERGSGIDKVVAEIERHHLPAPVFEAPPNFTRVVLFGRKPMADMDRAERVRACYLHACLQYVNRKRMTNASLRERFGITNNNASMASRFLNEAVAAGVIVIVDPAVGTRNRSYAPFWAAPEPDWDAPALIR